MTERKHASASAMRQERDKTHRDWDGGRDGKMVRTCDGQTKITSGVYNKTLDQ